MLEVDLTCEGHLIAEPFGINRRNYQVQKDLRCPTVQRFKRIISIKLLNEGNRRARTTKTKIFPFPPSNTYDEL